jgi:hypothetical protein
MFSLSYRSHPEAQQLVDEWVHENNSCETATVDIFWTKVISKFEFTSLAKALTAILCMAHGNSDVERGFSKNAMLVTEYRTGVSEKTINGVRACADFIRREGNVVHQVQFRIHFN